MTITINSGSTVLIVFAVIFAVVVLTMLLKKGQLRQKLISLVILVVVFGFVFFFFGRPSEIDITDKGIHSTVYGRIDFAWSDVQSAEIISDYRNTGWNPTIKINGSAFPQFKAGRFRLSNGEMAKIVTQKGNDAVLFKTADGLYLFALDEQEKLLDIASQHITF